MSGLLNAEQLFGGPQLTDEEIYRRLSPLESTNFKAGDASRAG